jgi:NAD(P)-dependent dehydrogenase (short-subunit alcohol dehydrogenase family)
MIQKKRLEGKIALVTGASRGIGAAIAKRYAREGAHVILAARTVGGLEEVDDIIRSEGGNSTIVPIDIKEVDKIDQLCGVIAQRFAKLDIFVGNAGILGALSPVPHIDPKNWNDIMAVNVTANYRFIRGLDPLLRNTTAGRLIFVTSSVAHSPLPFWGAYAASKSALETIVKTYAKEVENSPLKVNLFDPGIIATSMRKQAMPGEDQSQLRTADSITDTCVILAEESLTDNGKIFEPTSIKEVVSRRVYKEESL